MWAFWDPIFFVFTLSYFFENEMSDLLLWTMGHCPFHHYIHYWCDFTPCLTWVDRHFSLYCLWFVPFAPLPPSLFFSYTNIYQVWYFSCIILAYLVISLICFIVSLLILYSHRAPSSPWLTSFSIHVAFYTWGHGFLIIGYLGLVSLHFYYLITLAYITSRVLRPPWSHGIRCRLRQPLLGQVSEIWLIFRYHHAFSSGRRLFDVWTWFNCGYGWLGLHTWWWMIWCHLIFDLPYIWCHTGAYFHFDRDLHIFMELHAYPTSEIHAEMMTHLLSYHDLSG